MTWRIFTGETQRLDLGSNESCSEVGVDGESDDLRVDERDGDPVVVHHAGQLLPDAADLGDESPHSLRSDEALGESSGADVCSPDERKEPLVGGDLPVQLTEDLQ